jgi:hypothetical protein
MLELLDGLCCLAVLVVLGLQPAQITLSLILTAEQPQLSLLHLQLRALLARSINPTSHCLYLEAQLLLVRLRLLRERSTSTASI